MSEGERSVVILNASVVILNDRSVVILNDRRVVILPLNEVKGKNLSA